MKIPVVINKKRRNYNPDFFLPELQVVVEVKGKHRWEGASMQKPRSVNSEEYKILKCVELGKFNFLDNLETECFVLKCCECYRNYFDTKSFGECPYCSVYGSNKIIYEGDKGIDTWKKRCIEERQLFSSEKLDLIANTLDEGIKERLLNVVERLKGVPKEIEFDDEMIAGIKKLFDRYPNMNEVRGFIFSVIDTLDLRSSRVVAFPPILLEGSPGCGKTSFASEFAKIVANDNFKKTELSNAVTNFAITENERAFRDAELGLIIQSLYSQGFAPIKNSLIILDEIDKCGFATGSFNPEPVFHTLLEKQSAKHFTDNFIGVPIDASKINYIALCNNSNLISRPIFDRFKHFKIRDYTPEEFRDIVIPNIYRQWLEDEQINLSVVPRELALEIRKDIATESDYLPRRVCAILTNMLASKKHVDKKTGKTISLCTKKEIKHWQELAGEEQEVCYLGEDAEDFYYDFFESEIIDDEDGEEVENKDDGAYL